MKESSLTIGDVAEVTGGLTKNAKRDALGSRRPYLTVANVYANRLELENVGTIGIQASEVARVELQPGDLLVVEGNGSLSQLGRVAVWTGAIPGCVHQNHLIKVRPRASVTSKWLLYWLLSPEGRSAIEAVGSSTSGLNTLSISKVEGLPVRVRPLAEQHRIVAAIETHFSRLDAAVASLTRAKANLKRARASVLKAAVEGRLVPTEAALARAEGRAYEPAAVLLERILAERKATWAASGARGKYGEPVKPETDGLPGLPEGWCWASVDQMNAHISDGDHQPPPTVEKGVPFLVIGDVKGGTPDFTDSRRVSDSYFDSLDWKRRPDSSDLLYTVVGSLGIPVNVPDDRPFCVQRHVAILKRPLLGTKPYLLRSLASRFVFRQATAKATGTAQKTLGLASLRSVVVPLPPLTEQHRMVAEVDRRLSVLDSLEASVDANLARCARLQQAVLKHAFEGRLVPAEAPAGALPLAAEPQSAAYGTGP